jgi:hypothetical protein
MNSNIQNIKDIWNNRLNTLVDMEEYEIAKKTKDLIDKLDTFIKMKETVKDQRLYKRMEKMLIEMCQI